MLGWFYELVHMNSTVLSPHMWPMGSDSFFIFYGTLIIVCLQCRCKENKHKRRQLCIEALHLTPVADVWGILLLAVIYKYCSHPLSGMHRGVIEAGKDLQEFNCWGSSDCWAIKRDLSVSTHVLYKCLPAYCRSCVSV